MFLYICVSFTGCPESTVTGLDDASSLTYAYSTDAAANEIAELVEFSLLFNNTQYLNAELLKLKHSDACFVLSVG